MGKDFINRLFINQWTNVVLLVQSIPHFQLLDCLFHFRYECFSNRFMHVDTIGAYARLSAITEFGGDCFLDSVIDVGIFKHKDR